jgi:hypothetical protein
MSQEISPSTNRAYGVVMARRVPWRGLPEDPGPAALLRDPHLQAPRPAPHRQIWTAGAPGIKHGERLPDCVQSVVVLQVIVKIQRINRGPAGRARYYPQLPC